MTGDAGASSTRSRPRSRCYRHGVLAAALRRLQPVGPRREHSLTGMAGVLHDAGYTVTAVVSSDPMEAAGVNDRAQLAVAESELRYRINERWMRRGVTMWDPERTYVDTSVELEPDTVLLPGVMLHGETRWRPGRRSDRRRRLVDTVVGESSTVSFTGRAHRAEIGADARVGPVLRARAGCEGSGRRGRRGRTAVLEAYDG